MSLLVVGSVAFDAIETPFGKVDRTLGGAATYFALAASLFSAANWNNVMSGSATTVSTSGGLARLKVLDV
jgi:hypothetical protein